MKHPSTRIGAAAVLIAALSLTAVGAANATTVSSAESSTAVVDSTTTDFYSTPSVLPANNGDIIRTQPSVFYLDPLKTIKAQASVTRIMYRSTGSHGEATAVTGTVLVPTAAWLGKGPRPLVSYAAGTQGLNDSCAPSRQMAVGGEYEGTFIAGLLTRGYSVVVTDYQGLGTDGMHNYMSRASQGHAVLDAARAAKRLGSANILPTAPVAIAGYSQGGGASASAAELAPEYAPEINLKGAYAGAVPAELSAVAKNLDGGAYGAFLGYALIGLSADYGVNFNNYLNQAGKDRMAAIATQCTIAAVANNAFMNTATMTVSGQKVSSLVGQAEFSSIITEQTIGNRRVPRVPVLLSHSVLDDVIPYKVGVDLAKRWCAQGANLYFDTTGGPTHIGGYVAAAPAAFAFLEQRFAGTPTVSNCWLY
ncbi:lipase family protein [Pseudarthrobacter sp. J1738]|uniref:lipase family protein n=1 Tax=unclassified Pseudarthrobacter TaxID=2647000 RepID=UPI003D2E1400